MPSCSRRRSASAKSLTSRRRRPTWPQPPTTRKSLDHGTSGAGASDPSTLLDPNITPGEETFHEIHDTDDAGLGPRTASAGPGGHRPKLSRQAGEDHRA